MFLILAFFVCGARDQTGDLRLVGLCSSLSFILALIVILTYLLPDNVTRSSFDLVKERN